MTDGLIDLDTLDAGLADFDGDFRRVANDIGPVPVWLKGLRESASNADLMAGLGGFWFEELDTSRKDACLKAMLAVCTDIAAEEYEAWWKVVSACAASGAPNAEKLCREWSRSAPAKYCDQGFDHAWNHPGSQIGVGSLITQATDRGFDPEPWRRGSETVEAEVAPPSSALGRRLSDILVAERGYKRLEEHGGDLYTGEVTVLASPGGQAKTTFATSIVVSLAGGQPCMGRTVRRRRRVLHVSREEALGEVSLKYRTALEHHGRRRSIPADVADFISVLAPDECADMIFTRMSAARREEINPAGFALLKACITRHRAEVVVLDPWACLVPVGANENGLVYAVIQSLKRLAEELGAAIIVIAHTRKGGGTRAEGVEGAEAVAGASALVNGCRRAIGVAKVSAEDALKLGVPYGEEENLRQVTNLKGNYEVSGGSGRYILLKSVSAGNARPPLYPDPDLVAVAEPFTPQAPSSMPVAALRAAAVAIARGVPAGGPLSPSKQARGRYFAPVIGPAVAAAAGFRPERALRAAEEAVRALDDMGAAVTVDVPTPGRNKVKGMKLRWANTPWADEPPPAGPHVL